MNYPHNPNICIAKRGETITGAGAAQSMHRFSTARPGDDRVPAEPFSTWLPCMTDAAGARRLC
jgi:hypothetical protein